MLSVKELRNLAAALVVEDFSRQLGPFALIQRPPDEAVAQKAVELGAQRTLPNVLLGQGDLRALVLEFDQMAVATLPPMTGDAELTVGRLPDCDLVIDDPSVSKRHAVLRWDGARRRATLSELGSKNGTRINGSEVGAKDLLADGDLLSFGDAQFVFMLSGSLHSRLCNEPPGRPAGAPPPR